jgi:hypothetical protein
VGVGARTADSSFLASLGCRNDKGGGSGWASHDKVVDRWGRRNDKGVGSFAQGIGRGM